MEVLPPVAPANYFHLMIVSGMALCNAKVFSCVQYGQIYMKPYIHTFYSGKMNSKEYTYTNVVCTLDNPQLTELHQWELGK